MKLALRRAAVGAIAFVATAGFAAPAFAADPADLKLTAGGGTLSLGTVSKDIHVTVTNAGTTGVADGFKVTFDTTGLDSSKVSLALPAHCVSNVCSYVGQFGPAENLDFISYKLKRVDGAKAGAAGSLKVSVSSATEDPDSKNNSATVDVTLSEAGGVDLRTLAWDIVSFEGEDSRPSYPGETTEFFGIAYNQGDTTAKGYKATVKLPEGVTFVESSDEKYDNRFCTFSDGNTAAVCTFADDIIEPGKFSEDTKWGFVLLPVKIAADVAAPVNLPGGLLTIEALGKVVEEESAVGTFSAPANREAPASITKKFKDVDATDNSDEFIAYVGKPGGAGGGLPVTGANIAMIGGAGAAILVAGGVLFLITRRRRLVA